MPHTVLVARQCPVAGPEMRVNGPATGHRLAPGADLSISGKLPLALNWMVFRQLRKVLCAKLDFSP